MYVPNCLLLSVCTMQDFLTANNLDQFRSVLAGRGVNTVEDLRSHTDASLAEAGMTKIQQRRIRRALPPPSEPGPPGCGSFVASTFVGLVVVIGFLR